MPKNMASKGRARQKNIKCKGGGGGGHQKNSFKFRSEGICDNRELNQSGISLNLGTGQTGHATPFNEREGALLFIKTSTK